MKKCRILFSATAIFILIVSALGGCTNDSARRYINTDPNTNNMAAPNTPSIPNNVVGRADNNSDGNRISATYEVVDFSYITANSDSLNVKAGAGTKFPSIGTIKSGQKIRALGKLDGWYVVKIPDSGRIGCIPSASAKPYGTTGAKTAAPAPDQDSSPGKGDAPGGGTGTTGAAAGSGAMSSDESKILQLVNAERSKNGAKSLSASSECAKLARMKSQDMVDNNYFSHQSPTYGSPFDMLKSNNVSYMYAGENIAMNQSAEAAFKAWMNSEGHRKNILNPNFTELGIGISSKGNGSYIYTQLFIGR
mgnify:CR=1 FL=1